MEYDHSMGNFGMKTPPNPIFHPKSFFFGDFLSQKYSFSSTDFPKIPNKSQKKLHVGRSWLCPQCKNSGKNPQNLGSRTNFGRAQKSKGVFQYLFHIWDFLGSRFSRGIRCFSLLLQHPVLLVELCGRKSKEKIGNFILFFGKRN